MIVRELLTRLGFQVDETGAKQYERSMDRVRGHAATLQRNLGGILGTIGIGMGFAFFKNVTSEFTDMESRLANVLGGADVAASAMGRLNDVALLTYQNTGQVINGFLQMESALTPLGLTIDQQVDLQQSIADGFTATGVKGQEAARAMMWLNRGFMKGSLSAEEINGLLESSDELLQQFAEHAGVTNVQALKDMAKEGKVTSRQLVEFFQKFQTKFRRESEEMPVTINDALSRIQGRFAWFVYQQDKATGVSYYLAQGLLKISDHIEVLAGVVAALMIPALMGLVVWVVSTTAAFLGLTAALLANPLTWLVLAIAAVGLALQDLYLWFTGGKSMLESWIGSSAKVAAGIRSDWEGIKWLFRTVWEALVAGFSTAKAKLGAAWQAVLTAIKDPWNLLWMTTLPGIVQTFAPTLYEGIKTAFSDALLWLKGEWTRFWQSIKDGIASFIPSVDPSALSGLGSSFPAPEAVPARASGGPVRSGSSYLVGEEGPERFVAGRSGWILPTGLTEMLSRPMGVRSGSGGQQVTIGDVNVSADITLPAGTDEDSASRIMAGIERTVQDGIRRAITSTLSSFPETV